MSYYNIFILFKKYLLFFYHFFHDITSIKLITNNLVNLEKILLLKEYFIFSFLFYNTLFTGVASQSSISRIYDSNFNKNAYLLVLG